MKILILSCGTGGGHNSAAVAIQEGFLDRKIEADFVEYLDIINSKVKDRVNNLYISTTRGNGRAFKTVYHLGELYEKTKLKSPVYQLNFLNRKKLYQYIVQNGYDYIITTHLFAAQALTAIKKRHTIHFIAVATDYVCIPFWEETNPDYFIIPSEDLAADFIKKGIKNERLLSYGIPVKKSFVCKDNSSKNDEITLETEEGKNEILSKIEREENLDDKTLFKLKKDEKYILILTGSMGFGNVYDMIKELLANIPKMNFIVVCGNNKELFENLQKIYFENDRVIPIPFTKNVAEYMKISEIVLTKPGGLTTTEIAVLGKPLVHTMPIPGCENYNADYFYKKEMSLKCNSIVEVVQNTKMLLQNKSKMQEMVQNQRKYMKRDTCDKIVDLIIREENKIN